MANLARKDNAMREQSREGGSAVNLNRMGAHQISGPSLHSSGDHHARLPGGQKPGNTIEESVAAMDRPPMEVEGLFEFLRKEYYRRMGIYINGSKNDANKLFDFWKENVSVAYKALREKEKEVARQKKAQEQNEQLQRMQFENPNAYNRIMVEREAKQKAKEEQLLRSSKIQGR